MSGSRGLLQVHSAPAALRPHLEWALGAVVGAPIQLNWVEQPLEPRSYRAAQPWRGSPGTGSKLVSSLLTSNRVRFEVVEEPNGDAEGSRWSYTPRLGLFSARIGATGDVMVHEDRLRQALLTDSLGRKPLTESINELLGTDWDAELEPFRQAGADTSVRWLHQVG